MQILDPRLSGILYRWLLALSALLISASALADGMYSWLGHLQPTSIPYQRALVSWRSDKETMVVQSILRGAPGDYAWVIPVPNAPTTIVPVDFESLFRLEYELPPGAANGFLSPPGFGVSLSVVLFVFGVSALWNPRRNRMVSIVGFAFAVCAILLFFLFPMFAQVRGASAGRVSVLSSEEAGSYHVEVVKSKDPSAMLDWLRTHHANVPPAVSDAVSAYVKDGWVFVVATLQHPTGGSAAPHPLALTFPSTRPIYPMRLTASQGTQVVVDLYVLASGSADCPPLRTWVSRAVRGSETLEPHDLADPDSFRMMPYQTLAWKGAMITRLRAEVQPEEMRRDFDITIGPAKFQQARVMRRRDWHGSVICAVSLALGVATFVTGLVACFFEWPKGRAVKLAALFALLSCVLAFGDTVKGVESIEADLVMAGSTG